LSTECRVMAVIPKISFVTTPNMVGIYEVKI